jgi:phosphatidylglycerol:prolipoprotein diacylglycerol transferase
MMGIQIGRYTIFYYGIIIMLGAIAAAWLAAVEARRKGQSTDIVWDGLVWVLIGGIIGARIWHILTPPASMVEAGYTTMFYLTHPLNAINIRAGGLGIPGAVIGGLLAMYIFTRRRKLDFAFWLDVAAPALALGQAIGRWGNFFNQELYGSPSDLPWAINISPENRLPGYENYATFHPLFLYESLWNFGIVILLLWLGRKFEDRLFNGDLFLIYLITYPLGRFLLEFIRLDPARFGGVNINQTVMLLVMLIAAGALIWRHRNRNDLDAETVGVEE